jgi:hypothetical protein
MDMAVVVEQQCNLAMPFDARNWIDGDAAQILGMLGRFQIESHGAALIEMT